MYLPDVVRVFQISGGAVAALVVVAATAVAQGGNTDVSGVWIDHTGQGAVEIGPCGNLGGSTGPSNRVCGRVVWLKNPDHRSKSGKRICGTQVLGDLRQETGNAWESGWIYNPEDEERFSASLELASADTLMVTGYLGVKFLGETFTWKRAMMKLERCAPGAGTHAGTP